MTFQPLLKDKVILITGSTHGIGAATARACVAAGAKVMLHGRHESHAREMLSLLGDQVSYCVKDLMHPDVSRFLLDKTIERFGRLDVLVNNAGIFPRNNITTLTNEFYDHVMTVNLRAPLFLAHEAVRVFREHKIKGNIINIGSINAYTGQNDLLVYSISKGGLMTMTRNLADFLGPEGIRVNQLNVGWTVTETELHIKKQEGLPDNWEELLPKMFAPSGKLMRPENIAQHVVFWASDISAPVSGQVYEVEQYPLMGRNLINEIV